ncbi:MAG: hypothetical protein MI741_14405, partial [Rhodospirillales bacterium]|nr:hypothetical protein [Rhodospirillales bacterium]
MKVSDHSATLNDQVSEYRSSVRFPEDSFKTSPPSGAGRRGGEGGQFDAYNKRQRQSVKAPTTSIIDCPKRTLPVKENAHVLMRTLEIESSQ